MAEPLSTSATLPSARSENSDRRLTIALVGNPNTGKTTLFNALAGMRQRVGNYPGVTVESKKGQFVHEGQSIDLIDLPGTYSLAPRSPDESVAVDVILGHQEGEARPQVVVSIVDASNLERNLYLTTQLLELGVPVVLALNMVDVAERQGLRLDVERLQQQLGLPIVQIQANKGKGLDQLKRVIARAATEGKLPPEIPFPPALDAEATALLHRCPELGSKFLARRLLFDLGGYLETRLARNHPELPAYLQEARQRLAAAGCPVPATEARTRYGWIRSSLAGCIVRPAHRPVTGTDRIDRILTHRVWGSLIFALMMFLVFQAIFTGARPLMDLIGAGKDWIADALRGQMAPGPLTSLLADGIVEGVGSVVVFLPQILILFGFLAVLEDCGYMARAAFLMDKLMSRCGLSGKSFIPLLSSLACAVPGILATRVIEHRRDRQATILVAPLMSCSARLPVYTLLIGAFLTEGHAWWVPGTTMFGLYLLGLVLAPLMALLLKRTFLRGETPAFVMEMPLYKWPSLGTVVRRMSDAGMAFLRRAGTLILAAMILVWALLYFPATDATGTGYEQKLALVREQAESSKEADREALEAEAHRLYGEWKRQSYLGRMGRSIEPVVRPLGWDWRIGMAVLASFPAREVVVGTLGIIYNQGQEAAADLESAPNVADSGLGKALREAVWENEPQRHVFTAPVALSLLVFFALCCQCVSTLVVIRRETGTWLWPTFTFVYMTGLAYVVALVVYQIGSRLG